jgi:SAM-dependent methyltransferase
MEYADEPRLIFAPLSERDYCELYALEMDSFSDDADFYTSRIRRDDTVLELGCGSGRLSRLLASRCKNITAIDISDEMLRLASLQPQDNIAYRRMDMTSFSFSSRFDVIVIPYNTLNLLGNAKAVARCLHLSRQHLADSGKLLLQLYHPDTRLIEADGERFFQFAVLDLENGDKIIKETLKQYDRSSETCILEERYRIRPLSPDKEKRDLRHHLTLYAPQLESWEALFHNSGFFSVCCSGSYCGAPFCADDTTLLLIEAQAF